MRVRYLIVFLALAAPTRAAAQDPGRPLLLGTYLGASFSTPTDPTGARVGATALIPLIRPLSLYPSVEIFPDVGTWQGLLTLRLQPLGTRGPASIWYIGGGAAFSRQAPRKAFVTGVQWAPAGLRPFLELRLLGDIEEANPDVNLVAGVSVRLR